MATICFETPLSNGVQCVQKALMDVSDGLRCKAIADGSGKSFKQRIEKKGGSVTYYEAHCIAIDKQGYNVDESFRISYTIL